MQSVELVVSKHTRSHQTHQTHQTTALTRSPTGTGGGCGARRRCCCSAVGFVNFVTSYVHTQCQTPTSHAQTYNAERHTIMCDRCRHNVSISTALAIDLQVAIDLVPGVLHVMWRGEICVRLSTSFSHALTHIVAAIHLQWSQCTNAAICLLA